MITLGGKAGAGKGTVARMLADQLGYTIIDIGATKRALAERQGLSIVEFDALGDLPGKAEEFDLQYEAYQQSLDPQGPIILDSRLGYYNQPSAFNVFLDVHPTESAKRIFHADRATDTYATRQEVLEKTQEREQNTRVRYQKLYNVDMYDFTLYDLVIDTTDMMPELVMQRILDAYRLRKK